MRTAVALSAFFLSGFAGLVYEVCWIRQASLIFGSTTFAVSTVLAVFFLGLALGSYAFGWLATRAVHPLRWFALLELGIGVLGLASPWAFEVADLAYGAAYRAFGGWGAPLVVMRAALVAAVLLPAAFLMGGTLPLFCRQYVRREGRIAAAVGGLYGLNTLGAALGCAVAGLWLLPTLGLRATIAAGAALSVSSAVAVLALARPLPAPFPVARSSALEAASRDRAIVTALFFLTGFVALGSEVLWTRFLALIVRNTITTFTITLTVVLVGIVLGSVLAAARFDQARSRAFVFGLLQAATGLSVLALMLLPAEVWLGIRDQLAVTGLLLLPPAILSGASFPLAVRLVVGDPARASAGVGRMAAVNTLGGIAGSLATGFGGLPILGLQTTLLVLTGLSLAAGFVAWLCLDRTTRPALRALAVISSFACWLGLLTSTGTKLPADFLTDAGDVLVDYREGRASNLAVIRSGAALQLEIDRWWQGGDRTNHQAMAAHIPLLLHPDPRRVLVVGAGAGQTPGRVLMHDVEKLVCVDIEPAVFELIRDHFEAAWMDDARVTLVRDDGRNHVAHTAEQYDAVLLELGQIFRPDVALFYTADFYRRARARLAPGGVLAQFVPLPFLTLEQFRGVLRTFVEVFPHSLLWYNTAELLLVGVAAEGFSLEEGQLVRLTSDARLHRDLAYDHWGGPANRLHDRKVFLAGFLTGPRGLAALAAGGALFRDDRPVLDYGTSGLEQTATNEIPIVAALRENLQRFEEVFRFDRPADDAPAIDQIRAANLDDIVASALARRAEQLLRAHRRGDALALLTEARERSPGNFAANLLLGEAAMALGDSEAAREHFADAVRLRDDDPYARRGLATALHRLGRVDMAARHYRRVLRLLPDDPETHNNLGAALAQRGDLGGAIVHFERAVRLKPDFPDAQRNLERARTALGRAQVR
jgi:spermidine synthase